MAELGLPNFPTRASVERQAALHKRNYADHQAGKHAAYVTPCKLCREAREADRTTRPRPRRR